MFNERVRGGEVDEVHVLVLDQSLGLVVGPLVAVLAESCLVNDEVGDSLGVLD